MRSLWTDPAAYAYPELDGDRHADVCIIGAGFSGIGAAWELRNQDVVVLEERSIASGATGRNAGFVLAGPAAGYEEAVRVFGREQTREIWRLTEENNRRLADLIDDLRIECGYLRRGSMSLALSDAEAGALTTAAALLQEDGIPVCEVKADQLPRPFHRMYQAGLYYPGNAEIQPGDFVRGVARALNPSTLYERTSVLEITRVGSTWTVVTERGRVIAERVILATNAYTPRFIPGVPIVPTRGQVLSTAPLDRVVVPFPMYADWGYQYWRQTPDGRLVAGGWRNLDVPAEVGEPEILHDTIQTELALFAESVAGSQVSIEHRWAGIMGFTPDMAPLVGRVSGREHLYVAAGYSGHGVAMAFTCGMKAAQLATGGDPAIPAAFSPGRFDA